MNRGVRFFLLAGLAALALRAPPAVAAEAPSPPASACVGTLSGSAKGAFKCEVRYHQGEAGVLVIEFVPRDPIDRVPAYSPGAFEIPGPVRPGARTLDTLGQGLAKVAVEGGTLYTASKAFGQRGAVSLVLTSATQAADGAWTLHGTYRAVLVPAGAGKSGEVIVEVAF